MMMMMMIRTSSSSSSSSSLPLLLKQLLFMLLIALTSSSAYAAYEPWTCDDMTPNLCDDLIESTGFITTRSGLQVAYWKYQKQAPATKQQVVVDSEDDDDGDSSTTNAYPIIVINGGPGMSHDVDLPLRQLACRDTDDSNRNNREVIFYDQMGTGKSVLPPNTTIEDDYPFLIDVNYYANVELPSIISELNLTKFHIVADSWGTMIAMKYAIDDNNSKHDDKGLLSLTLNGPIPKSLDVIEYAWDPEIGSIGKLPPYTLQRLMAINQTRNFNSDEFEQLTNVVLTTAYIRIGIVPDCALKSLYSVNEDISLQMWSSTGSDFMCIDGTLRDYDLYPQLSLLKHNLLPILISIGEYDIVRPITVQKIQNILPQAISKIFMGSGHASLLDVTGEVLDTTYEFIINVEKGKGKGGTSSSTTNAAATDLTTANVVEENDEDNNKNNHVGLKVFIIVLALIVSFFIGKRFGNNTKSTQYREI